MKITNSLYIRDPNYDNDSEVKTLARMYEHTPLSWMPEWQVSEENIQATYEWLLENKNSSKTFLLIEKLENSNEEKIVGYHILYLNKKSKMCFIKSLFIEERFRGNALGIKLKNLGENWARAQGYKKIITHVMLNNTRMVEINKKHGFVPTKLEFEKSL